MNVKSNSHLLISYIKILVTSASKTSASKRKYIHLNSIYIMFVVGFSFGFAKRLDVLWMVSPIYFAWLNAWVVNEPKCNRLDRWTQKCKFSPSKGYHIFLVQKNKIKEFVILYYIKGYIWWQEKFLNRLLTNFTNCIFCIFFLRGHLVIFFIYISLSSYVYYVDDS